MCVMLCRRHRSKQLDILSAEVAMSDLAGSIEQVKPTGQIFANPMAPPHSEYPALITPLLKLSSFFLPFFSDRRYTTSHFHPRVPRPRDASPCQRRLHVL